jgi:hypothetical protein
MTSSTPLNGKALQRLPPFSGNMLTNWHSCRRWASSLDYQLMATAAVSIPRITSRVFCANG